MSNCVLMEHCCEVRIPTYKRPIFLKRALQSLLDQTHTNWKGIIYDDSPESEAEQVVKDFDDERFIYKQNERKLNGAGNIDQCFRSLPIASGRYACTLEDDNLLRPDFIKSNIQILEKKGVKVLLRNQEVWNQFSEEAERTGRTTRGNWLDEGFMESDEIKSTLFLFEGLSNGGIFWRTDCDTNFQVGDTILDSGLQEYCRTLQLAEPIYFAKEPLAVWSDMNPDLIKRKISTRRVWSRGRQSVTHYLVKKDKIKYCKLAQKVAEKSGKEEALERAFLEIGIFDQKPANLPILQRLNIAAKGLAKWYMVSNPLEKYWQTNQAI